MPVDNRNFIIEDLPEDPEDFISPEDDDDDDDEEEVITPPRPNNPVFQPQPSWQQTLPPPPQPTTIYSPPRPQAPWLLGNTFQSQRPFYQPQQPAIPHTQMGYSQTNQNSIPRRKKIIFCDLIDVLIESESAIREMNQGYLSGSNNFKRTGIMPRGLYDIRLKTEVWGKFSAFGADYVFCVTNQPEKSEEELKTWKVMTEYVMYSLADYLCLPHQNCKCLTKIGFERSSEDVKPGAGLLKKALQTLPKDYKYCRGDLVVVGTNSGYQNQSDVDKRMAKRVNIDYIDVIDLLTSYY